MRTFALKVNKNKKYIVKKISSIFFPDENGDVTLEAAVNKPGESFSHEEGS